MRLVQNTIHNAFLSDQKNAGPDTPPESPRSELGVSTTSSINREHRPIATMDQVFSLIYTRDQTELSRVLSEYQVDLTEIDADGQTALHLAISLGNDDAVVRLVSYAGDDPTILNAPNRDGHDALTRVSLPANVPLMKILIEAGACSKLFDSNVDDSIQDETGYSVSLAKLLITARGDVTKAFEIATEKRDFESMSWLAANGVDTVSLFKGHLATGLTYKSAWILNVDYKSVEKFEPIMTAAFESNHEITKKVAQGIIQKSNLGADLRNLYLNQNKVLLLAATARPSKIEETWDLISTRSEREVSDAEKIAAMKLMIHNAKRPSQIFLDDRAFSTCDNALHSVALVKAAGANIDNRTLSTVLSRYVENVQIGTRKDVKTAVGWLKNADLVMEHWGKESNNPRIAEVAYEFIQQRILDNDEEVDFTDKAKLVAHCLAYGKGIENGAKALLVDEIIARNSENVEILLKAKVPSEDILIDLARLKRDDFIGQWIARGAA